MCSACGSVAKFGLRRCRNAIPRAADALRVGFSLILGLGDCEVLAIIGARLGSKSVRDKNIALVGGKPLLGRIIETARASRQVNRVVVSTDSEEYAAVAREYHAETPFLRPAELAQELSPNSNTFAMPCDGSSRRRAMLPDIAVRCMATVPLQRTEDIDGAIRCSRAIHRPSPPSSLPKRASIPSRPSR